MHGGWQRRWGEDIGSGSGSGGDKTGLCLDTKSKGPEAEGFVGQDERRGTHTLSQVRRWGLTWGEGKARVSSGCLMEFPSSGGGGGRCHTQMESPPQVGDGTRRECTGARRIKQPVLPDLQTEEREGPTLARHPGAGGTVLRAGTHGGNACNTKPVDTESTAAFRAGQGAQPRGEALVTVANIWDTEHFTL